jgi:hypothetical protein
MYYSRISVLSDKRKTVMCRAVLKTALLELVKHIAEEIKDAQNTAVRQEMKRKRPLRASRHRWIVVLKLILRSYVWLDAYISG